MEMMPDREKAIKELEWSLKTSCVDETSVIVPQDTVNNVLALLKTQEPIAPIQGADDQDEYIFCCGSCGTVVGETFLGPSGGGEVREKYCPECGRAVKWESWR